MTLAGVSPAGALIVRAGEPKVLHIRLTDADGDAQTVAGRTFELVVRRTSSIAPAFASFPAELSGDGLYLAIGMTAGQASAIYEYGRSRALSYDIVETTGGATVSRWTERLLVEPAPDLPSDMVPVWADLPAAQALISPDAVVISERGATGPSLWAAQGQTLKEFDAEVRAPSLDAAAAATQLITVLAQFVPPGAVLNLGAPISLLLAGEF